MTKTMKDRKRRMNFKRPREEEKEKMEEMEGEFLQSPSKEKLQIHAQFEDRVSPYSLATSCDGSFSACQNPRMCIENECEVD